MPEKKKQTKTIRKKDKTASRRKPAAKGKGSSKKSPAGKEKKTPTRVKKAVKRRRAPFGVAKIKALAVSADNMADAAVVLKSKKPLADVLAAWPKLSAAWDRGRHVRNVRELASAAMSIADSAEALGIGQDVFAAQLESDGEIRDIWNRARIETIVGVGKALVAGAKSGKAGAIATVTQALRRDVAHPKIDFTKLGVAQAAEAIGYSRQALAGWRSKDGAPENADGTISLPELVPWLERRWKAQGAGPGKAVPIATSTLQDAKTEKLHIEIKSARGQLLDRGEVIAGLITRQQAVKTTFKNKAAEYSVSMANQSAETILDALDVLEADLCRQLCDPPEFLRLPPSAAEKFADLLNSLDPDPETKKEPEQETDQ